MSGSKEFLVVVSPRAEAQLDDAVAYIAEGSPSNAEMVYLNIHEVIRSLASMPRRFPVAPKHDGSLAQIRHTVVCNYRIVYEVHERDRVVLVLSIRHAARLPADDLTPPE